jgi:hypothetical protein
MTSLAASRTAASSHSTEGAGLSFRGGLRLDCAVIEDHYDQAIGFQLRRSGGREICFHDEYVQYPRWKGKLATLAGKIWLGTRSVFLTPSQLIFAPVGMTDKSHKHQQYDLSFAAAGRQYTCRTKEKESLKATDFAAK